MQFVAGGKDDGRQEQVEEHLIVKADGISHRGDCGEAEDEANDHSCKRLARDVQGDAITR